MFADPAVPSAARRRPRASRRRWCASRRRLLAEYWIVDPELETIKVLRLGKTGYEQPQEVALERGQSLASRLLPGLELALDHVFAD